MSLRSESELEKLDRLAQFDRLIARLTRWTNHSIDWEPLRESQALMTRVLTRAESLRIRLESPLIVATFGGTGTGKSSLINALLGQECVVAGRQRPTTRRPTLIVHPQTDLELFELPLAEFDIKRVDSSLLQDVLFIDCPDPDTSDPDTSDPDTSDPDTSDPGTSDPGTSDPDTSDSNRNKQADSEAEGALPEDDSLRGSLEQSNLERLKRIVPHCDVLIYTSTQQKYRSAKVTEELGHAATGCRLVFVQTHADVDSDIQDDWKSNLEKSYSVPETFFVDSLRGLQEQQSGKKATGDLGRLQNYLHEQLDASHRTQIRRANVVDLMQSAIHHCQEKIDSRYEAVQELQTQLGTQQGHLQKIMSKNLKKELLVSHNAWERRLLSAVTEQWGISPFSAMLRLYRGMGGLLTSFGLMRARTTAHMAVIGAIQGVRWLGQRQEDSQAESLSNGSGSKRALCLGLDETELVQTRLVVEGYSRSAMLDSTLAGSESLDPLKAAASRVEQEFLAEAGVHVDQVIEQLAEKNTGIITRFFYEAFFLLYVGFVLFRIGRNFFFDSFLHGHEILDMNFYIPATVFFVLWTGVLIMMITGRLRSGLKAKITTLADDMVTSQLSEDLFPELEFACTQIGKSKEELVAIDHTTEQLQTSIRKTGQLGAPN